MGSKLAACQTIQSSSNNGVLIPRNQEGHINRAARENPLPKIFKAEPNEMLCFWGGRGGLLNAAPLNWAAKTRCLGGTGTVGRSGEEEGKGPCFCRQGETNMASNLSAGTGKRNGIAEQREQTVKQQTLERARES